MADNMAIRLTLDERKEAEHWTALSARPDDSGRAQRELQRILTAGYFFDRKHIQDLLASCGPECVHADVYRVISEEMYRDGNDLRPLLRRFHAPVLVVSGRQDPLDPGMAYETHLAFRNSRLRLIDRCGHFPWFEQPKQFFSIVREFLERYAR